MDRSLADEARATLSAARAVLAELAEEGVQEWQPVPVAEAVEASPAAAPSPALPEPLPSEALPSEALPSEPLPSEALPSEALPSEPLPSEALPSDAQPALLGAPAWSADTTLEQVRETLGECTRCRLSEGRNQLVFGDGNPDADLMFVGEGPGEQEDRRGLPFVGRAGELLTQMIEKGLGISRSDVYICNVVKCRPPNNRTPLAAEVETCSPFLDGQIAAVKPRVIVTLGKPAASLLLGRDVAITRVRGTWHDYRGIPLMPTLHPAYILRQYTPGNRRLVWEDLKAALARARP